jgi:SAM-dependent methyltransferase
VAGLPPSLRTRLHDLRGVRTLDLLCGRGEATVELAALGALVTGVDESAELLAEARRRAPELPWVHGDPQDLPAELRRGRFELVHQGDALRRVRDPDAWAAGIVAALAPGGELLLHDEHPVVTALDAPFATDEVWTLGRVVTALARAGLVLRALEEVPGSRSLRRADPRLPAELVLVAAKPG